MRHNTTAWFPAAAVLLLSACSSNPAPYERPDVSDYWSELSSRNLSASEVISPEWWKGFGDPYLNELIARALSQNVDLRLAALRLERAALAVRQAEGDRLPDVRLQPSFEESITGAPGGPSVTGRNIELLGLSVSWELDLRGRLRKQREVRDAEFKITEMDYRGIYLSSVADVASLYFAIRQLDEQMANQSAAREQSERLLRIFETQYEEGLVPQTRILSQQAEINRLTTELFELQRTRRQAELELATTLGRAAESLTVPSAALRSRVQILPVPRVLPADMLARRPDVLQAEFNVLRAYRVLGAARLRRLPSISINASANTGSSLLSSFVDAWQLVYRVDGGGLFDRDVRREIEASEVDRRIAVEEYRRSVLNALQDVEARLNNLSARRKQVRELDEQTAALTVVRNVQQAQLREGLVSQLELFDTERQLLDSQQRALELYQAVLVETVELYKALGGGWPAERPGLAQGPGADD